MNTCTCKSCERSRQHYDRLIPGMNAPPPWYQTGRDFGDDISIGSGRGAPWEKVGHCATVCGFGEVVNHTYCLGTDCKDYRAKVRVGSGESGTTPAPAPDTEPTAGAQSDGRTEITCMADREAT